MIWLSLVLGWAMASEPDVAMPDEDELDEDDGEVVEVSDRKPWKARSTEFGVGTTAGSFQLGGGTIEGVAGAGGDLARGLQILPAVHTGSVRSTALSIRGGDPTETVWVVDGVPLQAPRSSGTIFSRVPTMLVDNITVHAGAQPARYAGALSGVVEVNLLDPADDQWDGVVEVSPVHGQAMVSAPLGPRNQGNALMVGARRTWFEPVFGVMGLAGIDPGWRYATEDLAAKLRLQPHRHHRLEVTALAGRTSVDGTLSDGAETRPTDDTSSVLTLARHRWRIRPRVRFDHYLSFTREGTSVDQPPDRRDDLRHRMAYTARLDVVMSPNARFEIGTELARFWMNVDGTVQDRGVAPDWVQVPWRWMAPPDLFLDARIGSVETNQWLSLVGGSDRFEARAGLRVGQLRDDPWGRPAWQPRRVDSFSPQLSLTFKNDADGQLSLAAGLDTQLPRDPVVLSAVTDPDALGQSWTTYALVSLHQPVGEEAFFRLDAYYRGLNALPVQFDGAVTRPSLSGAGQVLGGEVQAGVRRGRIDLSGSAGVRQVRRRPTPAQVQQGGLQYEPWFGVPWNVQARIGGRLGAQQRWRADFRAQIRSGVWQPELVPTVEPAVRPLEVDVYTGRRLAPNTRIAARVERTFEIDAQVRLELWAELLLTRGPLWEGVQQPDPDQPVEVVLRRDQPAVPWLGLRARF